jgi:glycosyltransferase involved in cell wall biosynthesis
MHGVKPQAAIVPLLRQARIFVAPYREVSSGDKDGIPTAVLEAMSTGLPVVATDAGSIPEVVRSGVEGIVVPQDDPSSLAHAIEQLLRDDALFAQMSLAARERVTNAFDIKVTESHLHELIHRVLESGGPSSSSAAN